MHKDCCIYKKNGYTNSQSVFLEPDIRWYNEKKYYKKRD